MLRIDLDGPTLVNTRFALSPAWTAVQALQLLSGDAQPAGNGWRALVREVVRDHRLSVVGALFGGAGDYVPDFLTPQPGGPEPVIGEELHAIATTGSERLAFELRVTVDGVPEEGIRGVAGGRAPNALLDLAQRGERATAERLAAEIEQLWRLAIAPRWPVLRARMEADIAARSRTVGAHGLAAALSGLHPALGMPDGDHLRVTNHLRGRVPAGGGLTLVPAVFGGKLRIVADSLAAPDPRRPMLAYPALPAADGARPDTAHPTPELLGATRARLLADLDRPRTTGELGDRHFLAISTVSYHLGILHRSGLVTRVREGNRVLYQHSSQASALLPAIGA
jgi:DNA-binding transcriptional ArsR family regulator